MKRKVIVCLALAFWRPVPARAASLSIGLFSFDVFTPSADGSPGVNAFNISNFTGAFDLTPDFPASTALTLRDAMLTVVPLSGPPQIVQLGNIGPGPLLDPVGNPILALQFPGTINFTSANLTATLTPIAFVLSNGDAFVADPMVSVTLSSSTGLLVAGVDNAVITAQPAATVSEPGALIPLTIGLAAVLGGALIKRSQSWRVLPPGRARP